ncbi:hypothetical protein MKI84_18165 [Ancylobacter sp. A5.8]|uniref:hypothetical protein n=1 Tax=Ancylobacter gelatini TaxID=2919920 RepID=UPI001F4E6E7E|nr:hypothetical protein [Ancylobacter gelatini]MCJ8144851.1 hypothetical protein [Ancylobacter gelatini]
MAGTFADLSGRIAGIFGSKPRPTRIVIFGIHSGDWMLALRPDAPVWRRVPGIVEVAVVPDDDAASIPQPKQGLRTILLPLMEAHLMVCPRHQHHGLLPDLQAVKVLDHKAAFSGYSQAQGLTALCPVAYPTADHATFPCMLKRCDLNGGAGIEVADSREQLDALLAMDPWRGQEVVLQSYEGARQQIVTHMVCLDGRILSHASFMHILPEGERVRRWSTQVQSVPYRPSRHVLRTLQRFLAPLRFSGPCNANYIVRGDQSICVFEFNPRLGGSLMVPQHVETLAMILRAVIDHARPLRATSA